METTITVKCAILRAVRCVDPGSYVSVFAPALQAPGQVRLPPIFMPTRPCSCVHPPLKSRHLPLVFGRSCDSIGNGRAQADPEYPVVYAVENSAFVRGDHRTEVWTDSIADRVAVAAAALSGLEFGGPPGCASSSPGTVNAVPVGWPQGNLSGRANVAASILRLHRFITHLSRGLVVIEHWSDPHGADHRMQRSELLVAEFIAAALRFGSSPDRRRGQRFDRWQRRHGCR